MKPVMNSKSGGIPDTGPVGRLHPFLQHSSYLDDLMGQNTGRGWTLPSDQA